MWVYYEVVEEANVGGLYFLNYCFDKEDVMVYFIGYVLYLI